MQRLSLLRAAALLASCSRDPEQREQAEAPTAASKVENKTTAADSPARDPEPAIPHKASVTAEIPAPGAKAPATADASIAELLNERLSGGTGYSFAQFANMFLVQSRLSLSCQTLMTGRSRCLTMVA